MTRDHFEALHWPNEIKAVSRVWKQRLECDLHVRVKLDRDEGPGTQGPHGAFRESATAHGAGDKSKSRAPVANPHGTHDRK